MDNISTTENRDLMAQARESLTGIWGLAIGATFVATLISLAYGFVPVLGNIASLVITGPLSVGLAIFALALSRKQNPQFPQIFDGFKRFGTALCAYLLQLLFITLWTLLLIIPGIIAAFSYSLTFFILAENNSIGPREAITRSKELMKGNKWKFFCLQCRFAGWSLLCILTLGIGFLWLGPYVLISNAKFYDDVVKEQALTI